MPVTLLLLIEKERRRQQPLLHEGGLAVASIKTESRGKSLMAIPVTEKAKNGVNCIGISIDFPGFMEQTRCFFCLLYRVSVYNA